VSIDRVFEGELRAKFSFDEGVASVFDDMLLRSIPFYKETQEVIISVLKKRVESGEKIIDLGCSTGNILFEIEEKIGKKMTLIGIDNSKYMIEQANRKKGALGSEAEFIEGDFNEVEFCDAKVILASYTLQFIRPLYRKEAVLRIYDSLKDDGVFIFSEKLISKESIFDKEMIDIYYDFKKSKGYSTTEIAKKREALENVLVPYSEEENKEMIKSVGFRHCETIFRWLNFATFVAFK